MATTTAQITLTSTDLLTDSLSLTSTATLFDAGTSTGITQTEGLSRKITTSTSDVTLLHQLQLTVLTKLTKYTLKTVLQLDRNM